MTLNDKLKVPEKYIPFGFYCYEYSSQQLCPFWASKPGQYPPQEDGYCHFLGKSDWDLNEAYSNLGKVVCVDESCNRKTIDTLFNGDIDPVSGKKEHFPLSLIWDQCKECGINMEEVDDVELVTSEAEISENLSKILKKSKGT